MTMLEILKERLPEGLEIVKVQDRANASQIKLQFSYEGETTFGYLPKACAPGYAERICDQTVCSTMMGIALDRKDLEMVELWHTKLQETYSRKD